MEQFKKSVGGSLIQYDQSPMDEGLCSVCNKIKNAATPNYGLKCSVCGVTFRSWALSCGHCFYDGEVGYGMYSIPTSCKRVTSSGTCNQCGGDGKVDTTISCSHSRYSTHSYCGHGRVGLHD